MKGYFQYLGAKRPTKGHWINIYTAVPAENNSNFLFCHQQVNLFKEWERDSFNFTESKKPYLLNSEIHREKGGKAGDIQSKAHN